MTSIFLSYARRDDDPFVARLHAHLCAQGFDVWWDKKCMPSRALAFAEEIRDAIHQHDRLVVVVGPRALASDYVRAEWQAALSERKPVVTLLRSLPEGVGGNPADASDAYGILPAELKLFHAEDVRTANGQEPSLDAVVRLLSDPIPELPPVAGRPPERPPHFLPRPDLFSAIFEAVLGETTGPRVRRHEHRVTVLTGMGGIGKTVLAASLVEALRSRPSTFLEDGIYWLAGDPLPRLAALCKARVGNPDDVQALADAVAEQLQGKRFLLVVDDAKDADQLAPLVRVLGPGGRMLVTTRIGELATGHQRIEVGTLSPPAALQLIAEWSGAAVDALPSLARRMAELCGFHPFAIALNAAAAGQGVAWPAIVKALERHELEFASLKFEEYGYKTVRASLRNSVDALAAKDRERYRELAAFYWEGGVTAAAVVRFWGTRGLPEHHAQRLLALLRQRSLLQLEGSSGPGDVRHVRLHDLHVAYLAHDPRKVRALGAELLDSYLPAHRKSWWRVADDGYVRGHLVRHLLHVRPPADTLALLAADDGQGRNAWYSARIGAHEAGLVADDGFAGYVDDVALACRHIGDSLLVLVEASLHSLARAVPGELLGLAVGGQGWSLKRGIAHARLLGSPELRARAMIALLARVADRDAWLDETLGAIGESDVNERARLAEALAPQLTADEQLHVLERLVAQARTARTPYERAHLPLPLHPVLRCVAAPQAAEALRIVEQLDIRAAYLIGLLPEPERSRRIDKFLKDDDDERDISANLRVALRAATVSQLAPHLDRHGSLFARLMGDALVGILALEPGLHRETGLMDLLPWMSPERQAATVVELLAQARDEPRRFLRLAGAAPPEWHPQIRAALEEQPLTWIAHAAPAFAAADREALVDNALAQIQASDNAASLLWLDDASLVLAMNERQLAVSRRLIDAQLKGKERVKALVAIAQAGPPERREPTLDDALRAIDALPEGGERAEMYREVAPMLTQRQLSATLGTAQRIGEPSGFEDVARALPHLSRAVRRRAVERLALGFPDGSSRLLKALQAIPAGSDVPDLQPLAVLFPREDGDRARWLALLALRVDGPRRARVLADARAAIDACPARERFRALLELGDVPAAERALERAGGGVSADSFASWVAQIAPMLSADRREEWVGRAMARGAGGKHALVLLAPHMRAEQALGYLAGEIVPREAMDFAIKLRIMARTRDLPNLPEDSPAHAAGRLAQRLGALGRADEALALVRVGRNDDVTAMALLGLSPWLSREDLLWAERRILAAEFYSISVATEYGSRSADRSYLTGRLAPALARTGEWKRAMAYAESTEEESRVHALLGIAQLTQDHERAAALAAALGALLSLRDVHRDEQIDRVAHALSHDRTAAVDAWLAAAAWARTRPRHEAVSVLASLAPVAAAAGGTSLVDEVFGAIERALRWWP